MALARVTYPQAVAGNKNFTVPFPYLSRDHISVLVSGVPATFTWLNENTVSLDVAPAVGVSVEIRRATARANLLVQFNDGSVISETDLRLLSQQTFFLVQEADDLARETKDIADLAASRVDGAVNTANLALDTANAADATANAADAKSDTALAQANVAEQRATDAEAAAASASADALAASASAANANATANALQVTVDALYADIQNIVGGTIEDFSKNSDNLANLTNKPLARQNLGLGNVDNTSDLNKPISTATQTALNGKSNVGHTHLWADITDKPATYPPSTHTHATLNMTNWKVEQSGTDIVFSFNGTRRFKVDSSGNLTVSGNLTAFGTV